MPRLQPQHNHQHLHPQTPHPRQPTTFHQLIKPQSNRPLPSKAQIHTSTKHKQLTTLRPTSPHTNTTTHIPTSLQQNQASPATQRISHTSQLPYHHSQTQTSQHTLSLSPTQAKAPELPTLTTHPKSTQIQPHTIQTPQNQQSHHQLTQTQHRPHHPSTTLRRLHELHTTNQNRQQLNTQAVAVPAIAVFNTNLTNTLLTALLTHQNVTISICRHQPSPQIHNCRNKHSVGLTLTRHNVTTLQTTKLRTPILTRTIVVHNHVIRTISNTARLLHCNHSSSRIV